MKGLIEVFEHTGEGISEVYDYGKWLLSIKNWREANSVEKIARLEIHYTTDQQFMLISGKACLLLAPEGMDDTTWFNNVLSKDCKLMYCESSDAVDNSEYRPMSVQQIKQVKKELVEID